MIISFVLPAWIYGQPQSGKVISSDTKMGIGYVNIGVINKNVGTVSDLSGSFTLILNKTYDNDSLRFSMIGYESKTMSVSQFREDTSRIIYLTPVIYRLEEIKISYHKPKAMRLGYPIESDALKSGFSNNDLGSELGVLVNARKRVILKDINLNVAVCTYDSVTYRINIYKFENNTVGINVLTKPVYISFSKDKIKDVITFDLSKYSIIMEGDFLVTIELYKDLGDGRLLFKTEFFTGTTYHRKTSQGEWTLSPGRVGLYLNGMILR